MDEVGAMLVELDSLKSKPTDYFLKSLFKGMRKSKVRRSDVVVKYAKQVIRATSQSDGDAWNLLEQIFIAALDVGEHDLADHCIKKLMAKFPKSQRVLRLLGMSEESHENYSSAMEIYNKLLEANPANLLVMKRKVCIHRATGDIAAAITELQAIVKLFPDQPSWLEMAEIYLSQSDYASGAYCMEEMILLDPHCAQTHCRLADCLYTLGGEQLIRARKHYTISLTIQSPALNMRALLGLISACKAVHLFTTSGIMAPSSGGSPFGTGVGKNDKAVNDELLRWGREALQDFASKETPGPTRVTRALTSILQAPI